MANVSLISMLLKHILGLTRTFGATGFNLLYLWYEVTSLEAKSHRKELKEFKKYIRDEVAFRELKREIRPFG